jgi:hypothetical protein
MLPVKDKEKQYVFCVLFCFCFRREWKKRKRTKRNTYHTCGGEKNVKYNCRVEPTVYYSRFMIYLCSETQNRSDDKQRRKAFDISRINTRNNIFQTHDIWGKFVCDSILHIKSWHIWWHQMLWRLFSVEAISKSFARYDNVWGGENSIFNV